MTVAVAVTVGTVRHLKTDTIPDPTQAELDAAIASGDCKAPAGTLLADLPLASDWNALHSVTAGTATVTGDAGDAGGVLFLDAASAMAVNATDFYWDNINKRLRIGGSAAPTYNLSFTGQSAQTIGVERQATAATAGNNLTIQGSGAASGSTNKNGGFSLNIPGTPTGTGRTEHQWYMQDGNGTAGTSDNTPVKTMAYRIAPASTRYYQQLIISNPGGIAQNDSFAAGDGDGMVRIHHGAANVGDVLLSIGSNQNHYALLIQDRTATSFSYGVLGGGLVMGNPAYSNGYRIYSVQDTNSFLEIAAFGFTYNTILQAGSGRDLILGANAAEQVRISGAGVAIGTGAAPTAYLHFKAGTAAANTAPIKFTTGTLLTTPELGAFEYVDDGTTGRFYATGNVGGAVTRVQLNSVVAKVDLTAQSAAIAATTIFTPTVSGMFRISVVLHVTTAASVSSSLGGATGAVFTYTEPDGSVAVSVTAEMADQGGAVIVIANGNQLNTTQAISQGAVVIYAKAGVAIQYAIGYVSVGTAMQYSAHLKVEAL